jgi:cytochrome c biogenesis protein CcmG, thiol:disulfide interchange protein DsbE
MNTRHHQLGVPVLLALLLSLAGCGKGKGAKDPSSMAGSGESGHAEVGKPAPDLTIQTLNGKGKISLESLQGKVVVVDFWATWCGPCRQSFPKLEEMAKKIGDKVEIVGISVDDDKKGVLEFAKETNVTFAIGWDENHALASHWKVGTMPTTFILDATGKVRYIHDGYHDGETTLMGKELAGLLDEPSDTRIAKNDAKDSKPAKDAKDTSEPKDAKSEVAANAPAATTEDKPEPPPKKTPKKGGRGGGKKSPPKKNAKKK